MTQSELHYVDIMLSKAGGAIHEVEVPKAYECFIKAKLTYFLQFLIKAIAPQAKSSCVISAKGELVINSQSSFSSACFKACSRGQHTSRKYILLNKVSVASVAIKEIFSNYNRLNASFAARF